MGRRNETSSLFGAAVRGKVGRLGQPYGASSFVWGSRTAILHKRQTQASVFTAASSVARSQLFFSSYDSQIALRATQELHNFGAACTAKDPGLAELVSSFTGVRACTATTRSRNCTTREQRERRTAAMMQNCLRLFSVRILVATALVAPRPHVRQPTRRRADERSETERG